MMIHTERSLRQSLMRQQDVFRFYGEQAITTRGVIRLVKICEEVGVDAVSVLTPMFVSQTQDELYNYYKTIAENTTLPIIMYNNKPKTNVTINTGNSCKTC